MDAHDLVHGRGEHAEGVVVAQVVLGGEGQLLQVGQRADVRGLNPGLVEAPAVKRGGVVDPLHRRLQAPELDGLQGLPGHGFEFFVVDHDVSSSGNIFLESSTSLYFWILPLAVMG